MSTAMLEALRATLADPMFFALDHDVCTLVSNAIAQADGIDPGEFRRQHQLEIMRSRGEL